LKVSLFGVDDLVLDNTQVACRVQPSGDQSSGTPRGARASLRDLPAQCTRWATDRLR